MIIGADKKKLQNQRDKKYNEYALLLNSANPSSDELNALKSELKYLDDQLEKINGRNEKERTEQLKNKKNQLDDKYISGYNYIKEKYKNVSNMPLATSRIIKTISKLQKQQKLDEYEKIKTKVA